MVLDLLVSDVALERFTQFMEEHKEALEAPYITNPYHRQLKNKDIIKKQGKANINLNLQIDSWSSEKLAEQYTE